ncbi:MAG: hypothetical protein ACM3VW_08490 [Bacteroidota bacterium]
MFLPNRTIFEPTYQQKFSIAGDDDRADVSMGLIDLYYVKRLGNGKQWLVIDPQFIVDHENYNDFGGILKVKYGVMMGPGTSIYVRPGVGFGEQAVDWTLELGYQVVW